MRLMQHLFMAAALLGPLPAVAQGAGNDLRIGVLNNASGGLSAPAGPGSVIAAQMAIDDFGGTVLGRPIRLVSADEQNKPDIGLGIARQWYDDGVGMIVDLPNTAVALAVQKLARDRDRVAIVVTAAGSSLTGANCTPNSFAWVYNSFALAGVVGRAMVAQGGDTWFLLSTDYTFGREMEADLRNVLTANGARMLASVAAPAGDGGFRVLPAAGSGLKGEGHRPGQRVHRYHQLHQASPRVRPRRGRAESWRPCCSPSRTCTPWGSKRPAASTSQPPGIGTRQRRRGPGPGASRAKHGAMPSMLQAGVYSAVSHYLHAVAAKGSDAAGPVIAQMKATPVNDMFTHAGHIRPDGLLVHDMFLAQVKTPAESKGPWDYYKIIATVPGEQAFGPAAESKCPLVKAN